MSAVSSRKQVDLAGPRQRATHTNEPFDKAMGVFTRFDSNKDGTIDRKELRFLMHMLDPKWTEARSDAIFEAIDVNKDGRIQFEELLRWTFSGHTAGRDQPAFRELVDLDSEVKGLVVVEVKTAAGETVFGPEELLGSMTVAQLRRKVRSKASIPVGCLMHGESILRDSFELGVYSHGPCLDLHIVEDALSLLSKACMKELKELGVIEKMDGKTCIRLGLSDPVESSSPSKQKGENMREFVLMQDGRLLAKELRFRWSRGASAGKTARSWHYGIAEGSFSLLDPTTCHVDVTWRGWAEAAGEDKEGGKSVEESLQPWEAMMADSDDPPEPRHLLPSSSNQINVLFVARQCEKAGKEITGILSKPPGCSMDGIAIPCIDEGELDELEMDAANLPYWQHGKTIG